MACQYSQSPRTTDAQHDVRVHASQDVFSKDLIIFPIHCHGNHWTLAVINLSKKRFEYYDSLRGSKGAVLDNLRRWLQDEHQEKKKAPFDASAFTEVCPTLLRWAVSVLTCVIIDGGGCCVARARVLILRVVSLQWGRGVKGHRPAQWEARTARAQFVEAYA